MALLDVNWKPARRELRQFALMWIGFFGLIGMYALWRHDSLRAAVVLWIVAATGLAGVLRPGVFRPVYLVWMALALPIGWTVSHLLLVIVYYIVLTPIGLLMRLVGFDPLERRLDRSANSYWIAHEPPADARQYFKQF
jgi:hypothetical protein